MDNRLEAGFAGGSAVSGRPRPGKLVYGCWGRAGPGGTRAGASPGRTSDAARPGSPGWLLRMGLCPGGGADSSHVGTGWPGQPACFARFHRLVSYGLVRLVLAAGSSGSHFSTGALRDQSLLWGVHSLGRALWSYTSSQSKRPWLALARAGGHAGRSGQCHAILPLGACVGTWLFQLPASLACSGADHLRLGGGRGDLPVAAASKAGRARATVGNWRPGAGRNPGSRASRGPGPLQSLAGSGGHPADFCGRRGRAPSLLVGRAERSVVAGPQRGRHRSRATRRRRSLPVDRAHQTNPVASFQ